MTGEPDSQGGVLVDDAIVEYLLYLRESGGAIALSDLRRGMHGIGRVVRLSSRGVTIACENFCSAHAKFLVAHYEPRRSVHFLLQEGKEEEPGLWLFPYPSSIQIRQERKHLRYTVSSPVIATWYDLQGKELVSGDVVDIGLGGFLASIYVSSEHAPDARTGKEGDRGQIVLRRNDSQQWKGQAELRRRVLLDPPADGKKAAGAAEFVLLGFAFQFSNPQAMNELTEFFQGVLGPVA